MENKNENKMYKRENFHTKEEIEIMDKLAKDSLRYGKILSDMEKEDESGFYRLYKIDYNNEIVEIFMHNGNVVYTKYED